MAIDVIAIIESWLRRKSAEAQFLDGNNNTRSGNNIAREDAPVRPGGRTREPFAGNEVIANFEFNRPQGLAGRDLDLAIAWTAVVNHREVTMGLEVMLTVMDQIERITNRKSNY
jgi:hypothetical protein